MAGVDGGRTAGMGGDAWNGCSCQAAPGACAGSWARRSYSPRPPPIPGLTNGRSRTAKLFWALATLSAEDQILVRISEQTPTQCHYEPTMEEARHNVSPRPRPYGARPLIGKTPGKTRWVAPSGKQALIAVSPYLHCQRQDNRRNPHGSPSTLIRGGSGVQLEDSGLHSIGVLLSKLL